MLRILVFVCLLYTVQFLSNSPIPFQSVHPEDQVPKCPNRFRKRFPLSQLESKVSEWCLGSSVQRQIYESLGYVMIFLGYRKSNRNKVVRARGILGRARSAHRNANFIVVVFAYCRLVSCRTVPHPIASSFVTINRQK